MVTITQEEYDRLKAAEKERDEYRRICGGRTPEELDAYFDHILELQEKIKQAQEETEKALAEIEKRMRG